MSAAAMPRPEAGADWRVAVRGVAAVVVVVALAGAGAWGAGTAHWPIRHVRVDGALVHADRDRIKSTLARHAGAGFFAMDLGALRADLRALPWVRDASLRRVWPDTLDATIREHRAAARWNGDALLSREGVVFAPEGSRVTGVPVLTGPKGHGLDMLERLRDFAERLLPLDLEIAALHQDERRTWRVELANGIVLRLGQTEHVDARMARFAAIWPQALAADAETVAAVDLRYPNGFAVAWRDGAAAGG